MANSVHSAGPSIPDVRSESAGVPVAPQRGSTAEAMLHLNDVESLLGGSNGPTIRLRAFIASCAQAAPAPQPEALTVGSYRRMFESAVLSLAEISSALGIPDDEAENANGNDLILDRIAELLAAAKSPPASGRMPLAEAGGTDEQELTRAAKLRTAGYTRRPTLREFPSDDDEQNPSGVSA